MYDRRIIYAQFNSLHLHNSNSEYMSSKGTLQKEKEENSIKYYRKTPSQAHSSSG